MNDLKDGTKIRKFGNLPPCTEHVGQLLPQPIQTERIDVRVKQDVDYEKTHFGVVDPPLVEEEILFVVRQYGRSEQRRRSCHPVDRGHQNHRLDDVCLTILRIVFLTLAGIIWRHLWRHSHVDRCNIRLLLPHGVKNSSVAIEEDGQHDEVVYEELGGGVDSFAGRVRPVGVAVALAVLPVDVGRPVDHDVDQEAVH